jgi:two-component system sensor histidine kinase/response regulator
MLDWRMPAIDGIEAGRSIRQHPPPARQPTLLLMTPIGEDLEAQAIDAGFDGCVTKPLSAATWIDAVAAARRNAARPALAAARAHDAADAAIAALHGRRVLLVEDNELNQLVATELLREIAGMQVSVAADGADALEQLRRGRYDVVLMDVQLPRMDGHEVTRRVRTQLGRHDLPIIAMTAHATARDRELALAAGMNDYITKPFEPDVLLSMLARWLSGEARGAATAARASAIADGSAGLSFDEGLRNCLGKAQVYERVLGRYHAEKDHVVADIRAAQDRGDLKEAARLAHSLISTAGILGAKAMSDTARRLENAFEAADLAAARPLLDELDRQNESASRAAADYLARRVAA